MDKKSNKLYIVMYHYIKDFTNPLFKKFKNLKGLDADLFDLQLDFFSKNFNVLTMQETISALEGGGLEENSMLLTFDDGYYCHYSAAYPILKKHNMQGSFFIPAKVLDKKDKLLSTNKIHLIIANNNINDIYKELNSILLKAGFDPQELMKKYFTMNRYDDPKTVFTKTILQNLDPFELRENLVDDLFKKFVNCDEAEIAKEFYLTGEQIKQMQNDGMYFGLHGYRHDRLGNMTNSEIKEDIDKALDICNEFINPNCWVMNYPFGHANQNVVDYVSKKGARFAVTTQPFVANLNFDNKYLLPRLDCNDFPPKSENYKTDKVERELCLK